MLSVIGGLTVMLGSSPLAAQAPVPHGPCSVDSGAGWNGDGDDHVALG